MSEVNVINIIKPFQDQKPGTSGLRKSTLKFQEEHYLEIFIEAILQSLEDLKGSTLVVGGDGRYGNIEAIEKIVAFTPLFGALTFPLIVPITISKFGVNYGILSALLISSLWFIAMLRTSEMPH